MTHYERLGVAPDATVQEVRDAYRRAARRHHPDAAGEHSAQEMAAINEAWSVLREPDRRRAYDLSLARPSAPGGGPARPTVDDDEPLLPPRRPSFNPLARYQDPPRFPWRLMFVLAGIGTVVVLVGVAISSPPKPRPPDNVLTTGSCVVIQSNGDAAEVDCTAAHDAVVVTLVAFDERCEAGLEPHRDRQGMGIACLKTD
ncbi:MAG: DnaJ domain-containing protein [Ilumatobacteraceae bacterium]